MKEIHLPVIGTEHTYQLSPEKIIAVGLNYRSHIQESPSVRVQGFTQEIPSEPILFNKTPNVLLAPESPIRIPSFVKNSSWEEKDRTDYEGELVLIIGKKGKNIPEQEAWSHIFGLTCGNDISQRNIQNIDRSGWFRGKSFDTFGPVGPAILSDFNQINLNETRIKTRLNGKEVQNETLSSMIFPIPVLISYISRQFTLEEGDLIFTGTPEGVGPLNSGDVVEVEIDGIGILKNYVEEDSI